MKIGIEAQRIFRNKKHGMDIYALELIKAIQKLDYTNEYVVFVKPDKDECLHSSANMKIVKVNGATYLDWEQIWLPKAIKESGVEVMHFTSNTAPLNCPVPYLLTLHDIIYMHSHTGGTVYQIAGHFYRKWVVPHAVKNAKNIFTVSEYEKKQISKTLKVEKGKITVIYNAYGNNFRPIKNSFSLNQIKTKFSLPSKFFLLLGNEAPKKNLRNILIAYSNYVDTVQKPFSLVILESKEKEVLAHLSAIKRIDVFDKISLPGYIRQAELPALYSLAEVFLYPSLRESFGIPIIEAMACGTPVITSNTTAMPEVANNAALLIDPENTEDLSVAMNLLTSNTNLKEKYSEKGQKRAENFSWKNTAYQTQKFYLDKK